MPSDADAFVVGSGPNGASGRRDARRRAAVVTRSVADTAARSAVTRGSYRWLMQPPVAGGTAVTDLLLSAMRRPQGRYFPGLAVLARHRLRSEAEGDTEDMNRERAETHLRLLAEEELRRATTQPSDGTSGSQPEDEAVCSASVTGTLAGSAAGPDAFMASRGERGADRAVTELYSVHYRALVRLAALLVRDIRTAEEVVQDSFVAMHGGWQRLRDAEAALAYLRRAVVNRSRSVLRHRSVSGSNLQQVPPGASGGEHRARVLRVAQALTAVGALDDEVADQILEDFELALATRQAGSPGRRGPGLGSWMRSPVRPRPAMPVSSRPPASGMPTAGSGAGAAGGPAHAPGSAAPGRHPAGSSGSGR